jgi:hypothetical protein
VESSANVGRLPSSSCYYILHPIDRLASTIIVHLQSLGFISACVWMSCTWVDFSWLLVVAPTWELIILKEFKILQTQHLTAGYVPTRYNITSTNQIRLHPQGLTSFRKPTGAPALITYARWLRHDQKFWFNRNLKQQNSFKDPAGQLSCSISTETLGLHSDVWNIVRLSTHVFRETPNCQCRSWLPNTWLGPHLVGRNITACRQLTNHSRSPSLTVLCSSSGCNHCCGWFNTKSLQAVITYQNWFNSSMWVIMMGLVWPEFLSSLMSCCGEPHDLSLLLHSYKSASLRQHCQLSAFLGRISLILGEAKPQLVSGLRQFTAFLFGFLICFGYALFHNSSKLRVRIIKHSKSESMRLWSSSLFLILT